MIAMVLLARRVADLLGMGYLVELTESNPTNLPW